MRLADRERRKEPRKRVHLWAVAYRALDASGDRISVVDLSGVGFKMRTTARYGSGEVFALDVGGNFVAEVGVVRADDMLNEYGCRFLHPLPSATVHRLLEHGGSTSQSRVDLTFRAGATARV